MDALLLVLRVREVWNFEWWERSVVAEEALAQDLGEEEPQQDCVIIMTFGTSFGMDLSFLNFLNFYFLMGLITTSMFSMII